MSFPVAEKHGLRAREFVRERIEFPPEVFGWEASRVSGSWSDDAGSEEWPRVAARSFAGTYGDALGWLSNAAPETKAVIVMFARGEGMESFLDELRPLLADVPISGGAAARRDGASSGVVAPTGSDVAILAITEGNWTSTPVLFHQPTGRTVRCAGSDPRQVATVFTERGEIAAGQFVSDLFVELGVVDSPWERVAFRTDDGRLIHLRADGDGIALSANLPPSRKVGIALFDDDAGRLALATAVTPDSLIFACGGLHSLLGESRPWEDVAPCCHLYGEVVQLAAGPAFVNLSISVLTRLAP